MSIVISVANEKGGVAKTTTTLSLGGAFAEAGYQVLVIDLDPQANLSLSLGVEPEEKRNSIVNLLLSDLEVADCIRPTGVEKLQLIPSNREVGLAERLLPTRLGFEFLLRNTLNTLDGKYDYVILDCPPFLGAITQNALFASDFLILPTQAEYYSIFALRNMMNLIRTIRTKGNPNLRYRLLLTMFDKRNGIHRTLAEHLRSTFSNGVFDTVIEIDTKLRESPIVCLPIVYHATKSRSALQYRFLAQEIIRYVQESN
jgi:chromosome partitioning protein